MISGGRFESLTLADYGDHVVEIYRCHFETDRFDERLFRQYEIRPLEGLAKACNKRKAEFLAGRYAAKRALEKLGYGGLDVHRGHRGMPVWPHGLCGSISHTQRTAICGVYESRFRSCGLDVEEYLSSADIREFGESFVYRDELQLLRSLRMPVERAWTLLFSAKESLFKALYPLTGKMYDFTRANVVAVDEVNHGFITTFRRGADAGALAARTFSGTYSLGESEITTGIWIP